MNKFFITLIIAIFTVLILQSCDSKKTVLDNVPDEKLNKTYTVILGDTLKIELASNPTTGFKWQLASKIKPRIVKELANEYISGNNETMNIMGAGGTEIWTFKTKKEGTMFMNFKYEREGGKVDKEKYFKIVVRK